ncbi:ABC transporter ATP-binding protein [Virgibacillus necropolis]|uniref:ABC transporter ATP-binding protein n=1 Tax=Virgibacillus necropolis TaxID=163877 RepID=UPI00384C0583
MAILTLKNLSKNYDGKTAVKPVDLAFDAQKCIALIGPNGAGKTTILRTLSGLLKPSTGSITFHDMEPKEDIRKYIGYLPQYPSFHSWMTGKEFLVYVAQLAYIGKNEAIKRAESLLSQVGLDDAKNQRIGKYSGGMKQRLGIAQAIIHKPKLLMLDEPVSSLDPIGRREVLNLMDELKKDMTILFSTHILSDADEVSDELLLLHNGNIVEEGSLEFLRSKYQISKIEVSFSDDVDNYTKAIKALPTVQECTIEKGSIHIITDDINSARSEILSEASKENWPLSMFTISRTTLEEMFMKAVNS